MNKELTLFPLPEVPQNGQTENSFVKRRVNSPVRNQVVVRCESLDDLLPEDHRARAIWEYVQKLDLSKILNKIQAIDGRAGRPATDPLILLALWIYAVVEGIGSARVIEKYCSEHIAFQWLCGGVGVNYHTISDFRNDHKEELDDLLTQSVALLMQQGLVELKRVAQDGVKVRANAGASSFRREKTLREYLEDAKEQVQALEKEISENPAQHLSKLEARRRRTINERKIKAEAAVKELEEYRNEINENKARYTRKELDEKIEKARISKTDCEARIMKMANGGFSPAYNVQFATETKSQVIVGVDVSKAGCDYGQITPMINQVIERHGIRPQEWLADPGYRKIEDIQNATKANNCKIYIPLPKNGKIAKKTPEIAEWRERMNTEEAKVIYKERAATAECVNAIARNRGLRQFFVRGLQKIACSALIIAITHNVMRGVAGG